MKQVGTLMKNQYYEGMRSLKLWILLFIFIFLGILSPATAKLTPVLLENFMPEGVQIELPAITQLDSWQQFFKNVGQVGIIVFLVLFLQNFWNDIQNGSLVLFITKGVNRKKIILAKWLYTLLVWPICYSVAALVTAIYTYSLFDFYAFSHLGITIFYLWFFGLCLFIVAFFFAILTNSFIGGLFGVGGFFLIGLIMGFFKEIQYYAPTILISETPSLLMGEISLEKTFPAFFLTGIVMLICGVGTMHLFNRRQF